MHIIKSLDYWLNELNSIKNTVELNQISIIWLYSNTSILVNSLRTQIYTKKIELMTE